MKKFCFILVLFLFGEQISYSQLIKSEKHKLNLHNDNFGFNGIIKYQSPLNKEDFDLNSITTIFVCVVNPELIYENKKVNFGLTKEASFAFPFLGTGFGTIGRIGLEYSYIFREERNHHLRGFFSSEIPIESGQFTVLTFGIGGGYFTDFKKNGVFPQISLNMIIPVDEILAVNPYVKLRHTFIFDKTQSDNTDISLGVGFMVLLLFQ